MFDKNKPILGLDIGRVISQINTDGNGAKQYLQKHVPGAFEGVRELNERFKGQVALVSKCGVVTQVKTREWFAKVHFYEVTGVHPNHVFFSKERHEKALICDYLGVTHFADDRLEVLGYLKSVPNKFLFNGDEKEIEKYRKYLPKVTRVANWKELLLTCHP